MNELEREPTLLLVDDDPDILRLLSSVIDRASNLDINVELATDPSKAKARLQRSGIDILLTDLEMPGISGLHLLRTAKSVSAATQVFFMTGHSTRRALLEALEFGASDYLLKPVDQLKLLQLLRGAVERQRRWQEALLGTWRKEKRAAGTL